MVANSRYKFIIGLGNPDKKYGNTYHNIGRLFVAYFVKNAKMKTANDFEYLKIGNTSFIRPLVFMNESGKAILAAMKYFKFKPAEMLVIHDDSDIELGKYKISLGRGSAGHRGVDSIIKALGTKEFTRLRIGIRPKANPSSLNLPANKAGLRRVKAENFVLNKISNDDLRSLEELYPIIMKEVLILK